MMEKYLNTTEAAGILGISKSTLYKLTHEKKLRYYKPGGKLVLFKKQDLIDFIEQGEQKPLDEYALK